MRNKPVGVCHIEGAANTHSILRKGKKFFTSCGIPLDVVDKAAVKQFLKSRVHLCNATCKNCHEAEKKKIEREINRLKKGL